MKDYSLINLYFKSLLVILPGAFMVNACTSLKTSVYDNWDNNHDGQLSHYEFNSNYINNSYFEMLSPGTDISYDHLNMAMFRMVDINRDSLISQEEFSKKIVLVSLGDQNLSFNLWDINRDGGITEDEFAILMNAESIASRWDSSPQDGIITQREFVLRIFELFDLDRSGFLNAVEFSVWKMSR